MERIVNALKLGKFTKRNLVMGLLGGLLIAAIIFLPEIISWVGKKDSIAKKGGLDEILASLKPGQTSELVPSNYHEPAGKNVTHIAPGDGWADDPSYDIPSRPRLNREQHRGNVSRAKQESVLLARRLGLNNVETKFALFDFANTLELVLAGTADLFNAGEAYDLVVESRSRVVRHIREEKVSRELARNWNVASISAVEGVEFLKCDIAQAKQEVKPEAKLDIPSDPTLKRKITPLPMIFTKVNTKPNWINWVELVGCVSTQQRVIRIDIFKGQKKAGMVNVNPNGQYGTDFYYRSGDARGPHMMRVVLENGDYFERTFDWLGNSKATPVMNPNAPVTLAKGQAVDNGPVFKEM